MNNLGVGLEKNKRKADEIYRNSKELNSKEMAEAGDRYSCACLGEMYVCGDGVHENNSTAVYRAANFLFTS